MKLLIIHFSDIHFQENNNQIQKKIERLFDSLKNHLLENDYVLFIVSGDIAFSGKKSEYKPAFDFFNSLKEKLHEYSKKEINFIFVPGNHDCFFDEAKEEIRNVIIEKYKADGFKDYTESLINICCEPQDNYFKFIKQFESSKAISKESKLLTSYVLNFNGYRIKVLAYNTSWFSRLKETPGVMGFPFKYFDDELNLGNYDLIISVLHHPHNWRQPQNARDFKQALENSSDIILSGHEHSASRGTYSTIEGNNTYYVEAPALQENNKPQNSGYNLLEIDTDENKIKTQTYKLDNGIYKSTEKITWTTFLRGKDLTSRKININSTFLNYLTNPGAAFSPDNLEADDIKFEDIFIDLNLKEINPNVEGEKILSSEKLFKLLPTSPKKLLILGDENSGKTGLCRYYYKKYFDSGLIPLIVKSESFSGIKGENIDNLIESTFNEQYHEKELEEFNQLDKSNVVIFLENFHLLKIKREYKEVIITHLLNRYDHLIITGNRLLFFEEFLTRKNKFDAFEQYQILECGPELRHQLINKWNNLGADYFIDVNEFLKKNDRAVTFVNTIVKKNLIPAYPFFVLTMLQSLDATEERPQFSMHGYYYQLIINKSLSNALKGSKEIGFFNKFITNYCYFLFKEKIRFRGMTLSDFKLFFQHHCEQFDVHSVSFERLLDVLVNGKLIAVDSGTVRIAYKYVYYFFVATYFSDNSFTGDIKEKITQMCERVYREEYANIIMFLVHLEKSHLILDELLENAKKIFKDVPPIRLEEDIEFINSLVSDLPDEYLEYNEVDEARAEELKEEEETEKLERKFEEDQSNTTDYDLNENIEAIDLILKINRAVKTIEILGQVTKKHWGEIEKEQKYKLAEETFLIGLRTLTFYFGKLAETPKVFINQIKELVERKHLKKKLDREQLEKISTQLLFNLFELATYGVTKRISNSIGIEELAATFEQIELNHKSKAVALINASIKIDHFKGFPEEELIKLKENSGKNYLVASVVQKYIVNYLYLYHIEEKQKQRLCDKFKISMNTQRQIDATSKIRKI